MSNDSYRYAIAAFNCRSISVAARKMNISSQGMGKAIKALEAHLGVQLFNRTSQGITPTEMAKELYPYFCNIVAEEDRIVEILGRNVTPAKVQYLLGRDSRLGDAIGGGVTKYCESRGIEARLLLTRDSEDVQAEQFVENGYDYRFLSEELDTLPSLPRSPVCTLHYLPTVNAGSCLAERNVISINDLQGRTILTEDLNHTPIRILTKMCHEYGFEPSLRAVSKTYIWDILRSPTEDITFIRETEKREYPWIQTDVFKTLTITPALDTRIVFQTTHAKVDKSLERYIQQSLDDYEYLT